jgi:hypothetical protein
MRLGRYVLVVGMANAALAGVGWVCGMSVWCSKNCSCAMLKARWASHTATVQQSNTWICCRGVFLERCISGVVVVQVPIWCAVIMHVLKDRDRDVGRAREPRF